MKQIIACFIALSLVSTSVQAQEGDNYQQMRRTFAAPNDVTTSCYWYWISGNISREGVINDLKSMKKAGINRAFIGNQGVGKDEAPRGNVKIQSPEWYDIMHAAMKTATQEGIEIGLFNAPGWSQAGGPWNKPHQSMRYLATQRAVVKGGRLLPFRIRRIGYRMSSFWRSNISVMMHALRQELIMFTPQTSSE